MIAEGDRFTGGGVHWQLAIAGHLGGPALLPTPEKFTLVAASAEGQTPLTAFDGALLKAGIGNCNLIKVSSVLPPSCRLVERLEIRPGMLLPTAYGAFTSDESGRLISAAIGVGVSEESWGLIMEYDGPGSREEAERAVEEMVREGFQRRGLRLVELHVKAVEHRVERVGCAFAAAALWY